MSVYVNLRQVYVSLSQSESDVSQMALFRDVCLKLIYSDSEVRDARSPNLADVLSSRNARDAPLNQHKTTNWKIDEANFLHDRTTSRNNKTLSQFPSRSDDLFLLFREVFRS